MYLSYGVNKTFCFPPSEDKIQNFISTMKVKIFSTSELELFSFDWSKLTFTWHTVSSTENNTHSIRNLMNL